MACLSDERSRGGGAAVGGSSGDVVWRLAPGVVGSMGGCGCIEEGVVVAAGDGDACGISAGRALVDDMAWVADVEGGEEGGIATGGGGTTGMGG